MVITNDNVDICSSIGNQSKNNWFRTCKRLFRQYGYMQNESLIDSETVIIELQERYNLFVDEKLNNETRINE